MCSSQQSLVNELNSRDRNTRLAALRALVGSENGKPSSPDSDCSNVNNHIHTTYSFSPYSPSKAVWLAKNAGLLSAGIMDHDSIGGAREFLEAGTIAGIATTIGIECRVDFGATELNGKMINNPDQKSIAYIAIHGIPHTAIDDCREFFEPVIVAREQRNRLMVAKMNAVVAATGVTLDYSRDVLPLSQRHDGGTVTERHLLLALVRALIGFFGKGVNFADALKNRMCIPVSDSFYALLLDPHNPYYEYDALALLKKDFIKNFYVDATDECPDVRTILAFAEKHGCICAYSYLGDVVDSVTNDKKTQQFEDGYLDDLVACIKNLGFRALTCIPSRNSPMQISRINELCRDNGFLQISGEDINSPRQPFACSALRDEKFSHLVDATWALIGHELAATKTRCDGFFSEETIAKYPDINSRIAVFKALGQAYITSAIKYAQSATVIDEINFKVCHSREGGNPA